MNLHRHLHLAAYDITDHARRARALKFVRGYATGGQKSVHELWLTRADKADLIRRMEGLMEGEDRFVLLRLDPRSRTHVIGRAEAPADPDYFYVD